jgi:hypothetical protein
MKNIKLSEYKNTSIKRENKLVIDKRGIRKLIYLLIGFVYLPVSSQHIGNIKSPQAYEMERYGNVPVNLAVGGIDLSIPIFNQEASPFNALNISLNYNSSGFIPNKKSNYVGLDWYLNYGGSISREVVRIAGQTHVR